MNTKKQFFQFVIPSVVSMLIFNLYTMIDGIYVARFVGEHALSAVNISLPYINAIFAFSILLSVGTSTLIALYRGENNIKKANEIFTMNTVMLCVASVVITITAHQNVEALAVFLGASEETMPYVLNYLGVIIWFSIFFIVSYSLEVLVKTDGFPKLSTSAVCIGAITNIVLDYLLIVPFHLGIQGAAIATGCSQVLTFLVFFLHFYKKKGTIHWCKTKFDLTQYKRILPIGSADCMNEASAGFIIFVFNHAIGNYIGDSGIVTYSVITYIYNIIMMTFTGISQGIQPLISFYKGRKAKQTCQLFLKYGFLAAFVSSLLALGICFGFTNSLVSIFLDSEDVLLYEQTITAFRAFSLCYIVIGYNIIGSGYFAAIEESRYSFIISLCRGFLVIAASVYIMGYFFQGKGIWYATLVCETLTLGLTICFFLRQKNHKRNHE